MSIDHTHFRQALQRTPFYDRYAAMSTAEHWATWNLSLIHISEPTRPSP